MTALEMDAEDALWFFTDVRSSKVDHLRTVNLSFTDRDQDAYVSLSGHGEIDTDRARIAHAHLRCEKSLVMVPGATHLFEEAGALQKVAQLASSWFTAHLTSPGYPT